MSEPSLRDIYTDPDLAQFYDQPGQDRTDFAYCLSLANNNETILDLGCGTGQLAATMADKCQVTGVDPAAAMLDIARQRMNGDKVDWIEADAGSVRLNKRFDLIVLTGHTFQVFLTTHEQQRVLNTIASHLKPDGRFIFDSRNPNFTAPKSRDPGTNTRQFDHPKFGRIEMWNVSSYDEHTAILSYENGYKIIETNQEFSASAQIRYTPQVEIETLLANAGLQANQWLGDWQGNPFHSTSKEIIPIGQLADTF